MAFMRSRVRLPSGPPTPSLRSVVAEPSARREAHDNVKIPRVSSVSIKSVSAAPRRTVEPFAMRHRSLRMTPVIVTAARVPIEQ